MLYNLASSAKMMNNVDYTLRVIRCRQVDLNSPNIKTLEDDHINVIETSSCPKIECRFPAPPQVFYVKHHV